MRFLSEDKFFPLRLSPSTDMQNLTPAAFFMIKTRGFPDPYLCGISIKLKYKLVHLVWFKISLIMELIYRMNI